MARTDSLYRSAHNRLLETLAGAEAGSSLPSEPRLAESLEVSRTVVRAVLKRLAERGVLALDGRTKFLLRRIEPGDTLRERFDQISPRDLEARFLDWVLRFDIPADTALNVAQLAKQFSVAPHVLQEFLASLRQFGLVEKRPRGGWILRGFTTEYAVELSDLRLLLEMNAVRCLISLPEDHPVWADLRRLDQDHVALLRRIGADYRDFSRLDEQFHAAINGVVVNRFVADFQKVISLIFHYHYQWNKQTERRRNEVAIGEHRQLIAALLARDQSASEAAARLHLCTSKETLIASLRVTRPS